MSSYEPIKYVDNCLYVYSCWRAFKSFPTINFPPLPDCRDFDLRQVLGSTIFFNQSEPDDSLQCRLYWLIPYIIQSRRCNLILIHSFMDTSFVMTSFEPLSRRNGVWLLVTISCSYPCTVDTIAGNNSQDLAVFCIRSTCRICRKNSSIGVNQSTLND